MSVRSGVNGRNGMGNGFRSNRGMQRSTHMTPGPIFKEERAHELQNSGGRSMMISKSVQKLDTTSNVSRVDIERVGEFN